MSIQDIANAFTNHFYTALAAQNYDGLLALYQPHSKMTSEGVVYEGPQNIVGKYHQIGKVEFNIPQLTKDVQLSINDSAMLIVVTGQMKVDGQTNPLQIAHTFQLVASGPGQYYIHNEFFRLVLSY